MNNDTKKTEVTLHNLGRSIGKAVSRQRELSVEEVVDSLTEEEVTERAQALEKERAQLDKLDSDWLMTAQNAYRFQSLAKKYKDMAVQHLNRLKKLSGGNSRAIGEYWLEKSYRKGAVDYAMIPELMDVDLEQYRKDDVETWKLNKIQD